jgi:hypothetical protein
MLTPPARPGPEPARRRVAWDPAIRIIASRYPPIELFERVSADPLVWEALIEAEVLTNPRVRDEIGEIQLVAPEERISGPGASWVMASFTHLNPNGSRFSDGRYGVYYATRELQTAIRETAYHFAVFAADSGDEARYEDMRVLAGRIDADFHDVASLPPDARLAILDPHDYAAGRSLGARLREAGSNGVVYPSVRHAEGECVGAFRPKSVHPPSQERHLRYHYDGVRVRRWFDYGSGAWTPL